MNVARLVALGALAGVLPVGANDTAVTLGAGGLVPVKSTSIVMDSEDLQISLRQITVKYVFRNTSSRDLNVMVAFPLPEMDGGAVANVMMNIPSRDPLNFMDFNVVVAGEKMTPQVEVRAFTDAGEITAKLRSLGVPLSVLDENVTTAVKRLSNEERTGLENSGLVDCSLTAGKCWPYWKSRVQFYWQQRFPANATVEIQHTYRPFVGGHGSGGAISTDGPYDWRIQPYCGEQNTINQIERQKQLRLAARGPDNAVLTGRDIDYILTTANNWAGPIQKFRLSVITDSPDDIVVTCMPGLKRVGTTRYELVRSDFHPDRDLKVLVLQPAN